MEGPKKDEVVHAVTELVARMSTRVARDHNPDSGPITWYSQGQLQNSAHRPWNKDGVQLPMVYTSQADMKVKFSALGQLFAFIEEISTWTGVLVRWVEWTLTEVSKRAVTELAQTEAVKDAHAKAQRYAQVACYSVIRPLGIADIFLLLESSQTARPLPVGGRARGISSANDVQVFAPEDVKIECTVDAEFETTE